MRILGSLPGLPRRLPSAMLAGWALTQVLAGCSISSHHSRVETEVVLPVERHIYVTIEGRTDHAEGRFIIDTGSEETMVTRHWADRNGLAVTPVQGSYVIRMWGGVEQPVAEVAQLNNLRFDQAWIETHQAPVLELPLPAAGVLGMDVMGSWSLLFDLQRGELRLLDPGSVATRLRDLYPHIQWQALPLQLVGNRPHVELSVNGVRERFLIDTGSSRSTLTPGLVERLGIAPARPVFPTRGFADLEQSLARLQQWVLQEGRVQDPGHRAEGLEYQVQALGLGARIESLRFEALERGGGLLGWDLLARWPFVVDTPGRRFWMPR